MSRDWLRMEERGSKSWWWNGGSGGRIQVWKKPKGWLTRACFLENRNIGHQKGRVFAAGSGGRGWRRRFAGCSSGGACRACSVCGGVFGKRGCRDGRCFGRWRRGLGSDDCSGWNISR